MKKETNYKNKNIYRKVLKIMRNVKIIIENCENVEVEIRQTDDDSVIFHKAFSFGDDYEAILNEAAEAYHFLDGCDLYINTDYICGGETIFYLAKIATMLMELAEV